MTDQEKITQIVSQLTTLLGFSVESAFKETLDKNTGDVDVVCALTTADDSHILIGHHGANLYALEHLIHTIARTQGITQRFRIDINAYREEKKHVFVRIARDAATSARREKKPVLLRPMNAYERRIIHTTLAAMPDVTTESIGEGVDRKVIVKPQSIIDAVV